MIPRAKVSPELSRFCRRPPNRRMSRIRKIAFVVNRAKPRADELAAMLMAMAEARGVEAVRIESHPVQDGSLAGFDACCVIGGDGTILGAVAEAVKHDVPIFGINRGKLGFLANYPAETATHDFAAVLDGEYARAELSLLECLTADGRVHTALNDIVMKTPDVFRMVKLAVYSGRDFVNTYRADGLVFSTPTGSTAYNLGAGGPLILPEAGVFAMTPICPHTLTNRAVIFPDTAEIRIEKEDRESPVVVSIDGLDPIGGHRLPLIVRVSDRRLPILRPRGLSHFDILRAKLKW